MVKKAIPKEAPKKVTLKKPSVKKVAPKKDPITELKETNDMYVRIIKKLISERITLTHVGNHVFCFYKYGTKQFELQLTSEAKIFDLIQILANTIVLHEREMGHISEPATPMSEF